jgi:hypothetical protein
MLADSARKIDSLQQSIISIIVSIVITSLLQK